MYTIQNKQDNTVHNFANVRESCKYMKELKNDSSQVSRKEIAELTTIFLKYNNKIAIDYGIFSK
jgi:CRISPR/Cas system CMR-associated protein Cmr1 (group 7 of RAMP superfamily)